MIKPKIIELSTLAFCARSADCFIKTKSAKLKARNDLYVNERERVFIKAITKGGGGDEEFFMDVVTGTLYREDGVSPTSKEPLGALEWNPKRAMEIFMNTHHKYYPPEPLEGD